MSVLRDWWRTEYADDILQVFRTKEEEIPEYLSQSPQLYMRRCLVDWLALIAEKFNICNTALHLTVYLLDHFMDNHDIDEPRLQLAALGCLSVASKFEERDNKVPRLSEMKKLACNAYSLQEFLQMEIMLLKYFNWELFMPTAAHFVECFSDVALNADSDLLMGHHVSVFTQLQLHVNQYIKYFLDLSLQDYNFLRFRPSLVAAACLASTRICLSITPNWSANLQKKTNYKFDDLLPCVEIMMRCHEADQVAARSSTKRKNEAELDDSKRLESGNDSIASTSSPESDACSR